MDHSATTQRVYDEINAGNLEAFGALIADGFVEHEELPGFPPTREGVLEWFGVMRAAFPDLRFDVEELLPSGDKVVVRARFRGTHQGEFMGMPATGKAVDVAVIDIMGFGGDGLVHEHWGVFDAMAMMQQLGAIE